MSCGCRSVTEVRAEDRSEVTRAFLGSGVKRARPDGGRVIDACFLVGIAFLFLKQHPFIVLVTLSLWWHMWDAVLAVEREGGVIVCK